jgi:multimeric flavodoxin WrbA
MKKILALSASHRNLGNGEILIKEVANSIGEEYKLEILRLTDLKLDVCKGCYACLGSNKQCCINDDLYYIVEKIKEADGIIIATPCYALGPAAIIKVLADRIIAIAQSIDDIWDKPCVVIGTYGIEGWDGYTLSAVNSLVGFMGFNLKDSHMFIGALPGEGILEEGALDKTRQMGKTLFGEPRKPRSGECPNCGSDIWKFPTTNTAVCAICGQVANLSMDDEIIWSYNEPSERFDKQHLKEHFQIWLGGQVQEYISRRKELGEIRNKYKENDKWVKLKKE